MAAAVIQFALSYSAYKQELTIAIADSLVTNILFAVLGVGLWYMVRFSGKQMVGFFKNLVYHIAGCTFTIFIWQLGSYTILRALFGNNDVYMNFMFSSLIARILTGVLIYCLLISVDFLVLNFEEMQERAEHEAQLAAMLRDAELSMLRSQIRPHFLFNSLNSVSALTLSNPQAAQDMIIKLSEFMRHSLTLGAETMNSLNDEMYHAGLYLDIERVRFSNRMVIEKNIDPACGEMMMPAMILQPLLENAVKHGVNTMLTACHIILKAQCNESYLDISISNTFDPDAVPRKGTGTGLSNVKKRMAAIYGRSDLLSSKTTGPTFEVKLHIPFLIAETAT
jgi:two-component system LytT family sensor kinase